MTKAEYDQVFKQANKIVVSGFVVLYRKNSLGFARLGLALSKKMIARAHDRNRVKRMIREQFRQTDLSAVDIVFLARSGVAKQSNASLSTQLDTLWKKLG